MNHKLRVLERVDLDPGHVTLEVSGCLTPANFPVLLHLLLRAQKLATCPTITLDFRDASHLDESVLSYLQQVALPADPAFGEHVEVHHELGVAAGSALEDADDFQLTLLEPSELPVCPIHGGEAGALEDLADALYRHLDTPSPAFGAHSWYLRVADELRMRRLAGIADAPAASDDPGPGEPAGREVPAG